MLLWGYVSMRTSGGYLGLSDVKTGDSKKGVIDEMKIFTLCCILFG
jgi:hypothetical protein